MAKMNDFERKAFRYEVLGQICRNIETNKQYYMSLKTDENGDYVKDDDGKYVYVVPDNDYDKERYEVFCEITDEFKKWALK